MPGERRHVAYLRLSVEDRDRDPAEERAVQTATVRRLAADRVIEIEDRDWGIGGSHDDLARRRGFIALLASIERNEVDTVYVVRLDRLSRDQRDLEDFVYACRDHGTRVVSGDGEAMADTANQRFTLGVQGLVNQHERELIKERIQAGVAAFIAKGNRVGSPPYGWKFSLNVDGIRVLAPEPSEDVDVLLDAYREAQSFQGAARLLNERGVLTRAAFRGVARQGILPDHKIWVGSTVYNVLHQQRPDAVDARRTHTPRRLLGRGMFRGLLRCHCSYGETPARFLTTRPQRVLASTKRPLMSYGCKIAATSPAHPRPGQVSELRLIEWAKGEVGRRLEITTEDVTPAVPVVTDAELDERRKRAALAFTMGAMTREELATVQLEIARIQTSQIVTQHVRSFRLVPFDWSRSDQEINADLRTIFREIRLDEAMRPVGAIAWEDAA